MNETEPKSGVAKPSDLAATLEVSGDRQGGSEPWGRTTTLELDASGFRQDRQLGRGAEADGALDVSRVRDILLEQYDRRALVALLDHMVLLRRAWPTTGYLQHPTHPGLRLPREIPKPDAPRARARDLFVYGIVHGRAPRNRCRPAGRAGRRSGARLWYLAERNLGSQRCAGKRYGSQSPVQSPPWEGHRSHSGRARSRWSSTTSRALNTRIPAKWRSAARCMPSATGAPARSTQRACIRSRRPGLPEIRRFQRRGRRTSGCRRSPVSCRRSSLSSCSWCWRPHPARCSANMSGPSCSPSDVSRTSEGRGSSCSSPSSSNRSRQLADRRHGSAEPGSYFSR